MNEKLELYQKEAQKAFNYIMECLANAQKAMGTLETFSYLLKKESETLKESENLMKEAK